MEGVVPVQAPPPCHLPATTNTTASRIRVSTPAVHMTRYDPLVTYEPSPVTAAELNAASFSDVLIFAGGPEGTS